IAHKCYQWNLRFIARVISQISRVLTGIEIHPGAKICRRFFIDHGMGVVIRETCEIGDNVTIYQGVTLDGTGHEIGKCQPTIEYNVIIASGTKVLGDNTIAKTSKVGGGFVVLKDVPAHSTVMGTTGRIVEQNGKKVSKTLDHNVLPNPILD